jgi:ribosomal protein S27AE
LEEDVKVETVVTVEATFPELKGGNAYQSGRGAAGAWPLALKRAAQQLQKRIGRRRFSSFTATITVAHVQVDPELSKVKQRKEDLTHLNVSRNQAGRPVSACGSGRVHNYYPDRVTCGKCQQTEAYQRAILAEAK